MGKLATLIDNRKEARDALRAYTDELEAVLVGDKDKGIEARTWTPEEEQRLAAARNRVTQLDTLIETAEADKRDADEQIEERERKLGADDHGVTVTVGFEDTLVYSEANPQNSWIRDKMATCGIMQPGTPAALERLTRHQEQFEGIIRHGGVGLDEKGRRAHRAAEQLRTAEGWYSKRSSETRTGVTTQSASMGDFAPPLYFLPEYAAYRTYGRTLIDALQHRPMPDTGLVFNVPQITQPSQGVNQTNSATQGANENTTISERDLTSTYQAATVQTIADNVNVSQQYLDRVGPGIEGDMIVRDDQNRQVNRALNVYAWNQLFATALAASPVAATLYTDSTFAAQKFKAQVHAAKIALETTDGTVASPTHFFGDPTLWESIEGAYDSSNRPYVVPQGVAFNPLAVGDPNLVPEGYTGFHFAAMPAFKDNAMWVSWSGGAASPGATGYHPAVVGDFSIASYWLESAPVYRVLPQPGAATLTVLVQTYIYAAYLPVYPEAIQLVFGTGTATANLL